MKPYIVTIVFIGLFFWENAYAFYSLKDNVVERVTANAFWGLVNTVAYSVVMAGLYSWVFSDHGWRGAFHQEPTVIAVILSFLALDCLMYWWHRAMHEIPAAWKFHRVHHTDRSMNVTTAFRFHIGESLASRIPQLMLIYFLGIPLEAFLIYETAFVVCVMFHHSNINLSQKWDALLQPIIITPNLHRVHHSDKVSETNSNYSSFFTFWDVLFGSLCQHSPHTVHLGLKEYPARQSITELVQMPWTERLPLPLETTSSPRGKLD